MKDLYMTRRKKLLQDKQGPCMVCIFSGNAPMRSADESYPFSVDRNFYYLTGIDRENMVLVIDKDEAGVIREAIFIEPYDEELAKWVGGRMKADEVTQISGIESVSDVANFSGWITDYLRRYRGLGKIRMYLDLWRYEEKQVDTQAHQFAAWLQKRYPAVEIDEIYGELAGMRAVKDEKELELMRRAQETTRVAIEAMMRHARPGMNETEIEGAFDFALMQQGCREHAFPTIAAGGPRATTLHYSSNNCVVEDGQMVLVDLGSAEKHYCADISRTFPVNGKFTERQKEIYNMVLEAQHIVEKAAKPGMSMGDLNRLVVEYYESRLDDLGLRKDGKGVRDYYYHSVTHSLGLDTHDVGTLREYTLRPGMVITNEPGFYIEEEGIGVRIEDDLLITEEGAVNLSTAIPKTVEEVEAIIWQGKQIE